MCGGIGCRGRRGRRKISPNPQIAPAYRRTGRSRRIGVMDAAARRGAARRRGSGATMSCPSVRRPRRKPAAEPSGGPSTPPDGTTPHAPDKPETNLHLATKKLRANRKPQPQDPPRPANHPGRRNPLMQLTPRRGIRVAASFPGRRGAGQGSKLVSSPKGREAPLTRTPPTSTLTQRRPRNHNPNAAAQPTPGGTHATVDQASVGDHIHAVAGGNHRLN